MGLCVNKTTTIIYWIIDDGLVEPEVMVLKTIYVLVHLRTQQVCSLEEFDNLLTLCTVCV